MGYAGGDQNMDFPIGDVIDNEKASYCSEGCLDPWLADGFCDEGCNNAECAYDSGKAMKSSPLLGPFCGSEFWGIFSV